MPRSHHCINSCWVGWSSATSTRGDLVVRDNAEQHRYEIHVDGALAGFADYHLQPGLLTATHTEIDPAFEGRGLGSELVRAMLDDLLQRKLKILAVCPFVRSYLRRHSEYADLVWRPGS